MTIDGFDIGGARGDGIEANNVHHINVLNNTIHGSGESGIQFNWSEFIRVEGNETYKTAGPAGFPVYRSIRLATSPGIRRPKDIELL